MSYRKCVFLYDAGPLTALHHIIDPKRISVNSRKGKFPRPSSLLIIQSTRKPRIKIRGSRRLGLTWWDARRPELRAGAEQTDPAVPKGLGTQAPPVGRAAGGLDVCGGLWALRSPRVSLTPSKGSHSSENPGQGLQPRAGGSFQRYSFFFPASRK